ncbi:hypothetical protein [Actinomadura rudentiformis]|uniref:Uncharacterized protein n=1 Tax=Actinomadura rudentiformis TaxID=359158 RepID=A0A6H9YFW4_9ACTN|nr:hypothetical protein [Actinomadura rudentiformis]KAB2339177.1 hypothetical protein F8566_48680 [Actinomadura rudentiformis]
MLLAAMEVARAAYEEALLKHGMLPSTVALIHTYAEANLAALEEEPDDPMVSLLDTATPFPDNDRDVPEQSPP